MRQSNQRSSRHSVRCTERLCECRGGFDTHTHTDTQTHSHTDTDRHTHTQTHTDRQTHRHTQTDRHTDTDRHTHTLSLSHQGESRCREWVDAWEPFTEPPCHFFWNGILSPATECGGPPNINVVGDIVIVSAWIHLRQTVAAGSTIRLVPIG